MHLIMIVIALVIACWTRYQWTQSQGTWNERWQYVLFLFFFPPLLIFMTAIAVICMGPQGKMSGLQTGWLSYLLALSSLAFFAILWVKLAWGGWQSVKSARNCSLTHLENKQVRVLD
ncbi:MAG: M56 family peptidase, partial [Microcystaceae cyanobacterium]